MQTFRLLIAELLMRATLTVMPKGEERDRFCVFLLEYSNVVMVTATQPVPPSGGLTLYSGAPDPWPHRVAAADGDWMQREIDRYLAVKKHEKEISRLEKGTAAVDVP